MGKTKTKHNARNVAEYKRGLQLVKLHKVRSKWLDDTGLEYEEHDWHGHPFFTVKKARMDDSPSWMGVCDKQKEHRLHTDVKPNRNNRKCSCGGTYVFKEVTLKLSTKVSETEKSISRAQSRSRNKGGQ